MIRTRVVFGIAGMCIALGLLGRVEADEQDGCAAPQSARATTQALSAIVLDVDGDGFSDLIASNRSADGTSRDFYVVPSSGATPSTISLPAGAPAPADYDGDRITDLATVQREQNQYRWRIRQSSNGEVVTKTFGGRDDTLLYGCAFVSPSRSSLTAIRGRSVVVSDLETPNPQVLGIIPKGPESVVGCGDLSTGGTDEIILTADIKNSDLKALASITCRDQVLTYRQIRPFESGGVVRLAGDDFPVVITRRPLDQGREIITLQSVAELFAYPKFFFAKNALFTSGTFLSRDGSFSSLGIRYTSPGNPTQVLQRLFDAQIPVPEVVATLPSGFTLVAPQGVIR